MTKTLNEVREARKQNTPAIFNMEAAKQALATTPARVRKSGALGDISNAILDCLAEAGQPLAVNQITAMLNAGGIEVTAKKVSDTVWGLAKKQRCAKGETRGMYVAV